MIQEAKTRFKNNGRVHDRIVCGDFSYCTFITTIGLCWYGWRLLLAEDIANGVTIKTEKSAILSETELEFFTINTHESQSVSRQNNWGKRGKLFIFWGTAYLGMPANPEFQELIIKNILRWVCLRKFPKCKYTAYGIWKGEEFLKNYIGAAATVTVSSGMLAAKLVIEELTLVQMFSFTLIPTVP
jgi:hypothetical protein